MKNVFLFIVLGLFAVGCELTPHLDGFGNPMSEGYICDCETADCSNQEIFENLNDCWDACTGECSFCYY